MDSEDQPLFLGDDVSSDSEAEAQSQPQSAKKTEAVTSISSDSENSDEDQPVDDEEDDPVVRTYDIYSTSDLADYLYLFQYPMRVRQNPYTKARHECPVEARWKPRPGLVEVDVPINVHGHYDQEKGRVWGDVLKKAQKSRESESVGKAMASGSGKRRRVKDVVDDDEEPEDELVLVSFDEAVKKGRVLTKQTLGSKIQPDETRYMVGVFRNDQLHLTPVKSTLQLRPQFHHIDAQSAQDRAANKALREADAPPAAAAGARSITLQFKNSDDPTAIHMSSNARAQRMAEEDEWTKLHWVDQEDDEAWDQYELLSLKDPAAAGPLKPTTTKSEYMDWLSGAMFQKKPAAVTP